MQSYVWLPPGLREGWIQHDDWTYSGDWSYGDFDDWSESVSE